MINMAAMSATKLTVNFIVASGALHCCVPNVSTLTIDASIFIPLIVGSLLLCALLDWSTRHEKDIL